MPEPDGCSCVDESYQNDCDPVPGGVQVDPTGTSGFGSSACRLVDGNSNEYMATCAHIFDACNDDISNESLYRPKESYDAIGTVHEVDESLDFVAVDNSGPKDVTDTIVDTGGLEAKGRVTEQGMIDAMDDGTTIHKRGKQTGATEGTIKDASAKGGKYMSCNDTVTEGWATYYICHEGGDSGGVYYIKKYDHTNNEYYAAIAGIHGAGWNCDESIGAKAETIYNKYGFYWT